MGKHMLFHNRHFRIMQDIPVEPAAQRLALAAVGEGVDSTTKRKKLKARKTLKKRAAHPPSAARCVGRR